MPGRGSAIVVDPTARVVTVGSTVVHLTRTQFDLLAALNAQPGSVVSRADLSEVLWGDRVFGGDHRLDVHVSRIRASLTQAGAPPDTLVTVRGVGYRLQPVVSTRPSSAGRPSPADPVHVLLGVDAAIAWATTNVRSLLGLLPSELVGRPVLEIVHPDDRAAFAVHTQAVLSGVPGELAFRAARRSGGYRWITSLDRPVRVPDGPILGDLADWVPGRRAAPIPTPLPEAQSITIPGLRGLP